MRKRPMICCSNNDVYSILKSFSRRKGTTFLPNKQIFTCLFCFFLTFLAKKMKKHHKKVSVFHRDSQPSIYLLSIYLSSIIYHLSSIIYHLSSIIYHLSSIIYHLLSIIYYLSSIIYYLSSIIYHLLSICVSSLSIIYHLSSIIYYLSSIIYEFSRKLHRSLFRQMRRIIPSVFRNLPFRCINTNRHTIQRPQHLII